MNTQRRFSSRMGEQQPCDALSAIALHRYTPPLSHRLFYACLKWGWVAVLAAVFLLTGCDDLAAAHAQAVEQLADQQDAEALSSREWAGQQVCGPHATAVWTGDKEMQCFKHKRLVQGAGQ